MYTAGFSVLSWLLLSTGVLLGAADRQQDENEADGAGRDISVTIATGSQKEPTYKIVDDKPVVTQKYTPHPGSPEASTEANGDFVIKQDGRICLRANLKVSFVVNYATRKKKRLHVKKSQFTMPDHPLVRGQCGEDKASLILSWSNGSSILSIHFNLQTKTTKPARKKEGEVKLYGWATSGASFVLDTRDETHFTHPFHPGVHTVWTKPHQENLFFTARNRSFTCSSKQRLVMNEYNTNDSIVQDDVLDVFLLMENMHIQAFDIPPSGQFSEASPCDTDIYNNLPHQNIVPIIVAACLAGIILIIIIAYFITKNLGQSPYKAMD